MLALAVLLPACAPPPAQTLQGYAEGEYLRIAAPAAGRLEQLHVARGDAVATGAPLFVLEHEAETAAVREAQARLVGAQAQLANLQRARRAPELAQAQAQRAQALAAHTLAQEELARQERLQREGFVSAARIDEAQAALARERARVREAEAAIAQARQSVGREAEIDSARAAIGAAEQALAQARWRLDQKTHAAPASGRIEETYFEPGEWVPAGVPVVSLLPPGNVKLRFFVPEPELGRVRIGQAVRARCDGCAAPVEATVSFIASAPEFAPPVLYNREARARLVFMVEARPQPDQAAQLHPGQPLDIALR